MEWLIALAFLLGFVQDAQTNYNEAAQALASLERQEIVMFADDEAARAALDAEWSVFPVEVSQGDAVMIRSGSEEIIQWNGKSYELMPFGSGYYVLLPVPIETKPGEYTVGGASFTVAAKKFQTQQLKVSAETEAMKRNTERIAADREKTQEVRANSVPTFLFNDLFVKPLEKYRLSTSYGFTRYTNGVYSGRHRAIDMAAPQGTPIMATAAGKVTLAEELYLTGNTIYIDHGMGLLSEYAHLSELLVEPGDEVETGQTIGLVGTTGFSTGPHLHFAFWIDGVQTNPDLFFESSPFHWK